MPTETTTTSFSLLPHQQKAMEQMIKNEDSGSVLAFDVGMGKTSTSLATVQKMLKSDTEKNFIVLAPETLESNWVKESTSVINNRNEKITMNFQSHEKFINDVNTAMGVTKSSPPLQKNTNYYISNAQEYVKEHFKGKIVIIDEAHLLLESVFYQKETNFNNLSFKIDLLFNDENYLLPLCLLLLGTYSRKNILLTATPIVNGILDLRLLYWIANGLPSIKNNGDVSFSLDVEKLNQFPLEPENNGDVSFSLDVEKLNQFPLEPVLFLNKFTTPFKKPFLIDKFISFTSEELVLDGLQSGIRKLLNPNFFKKTYNPLILINVFLFVISQLTGIKAVAKASRFLERSYSTIQFIFLLNTVQSWIRKQPGQRVHEKRQSRKQNRRRRRFKGTRRSTRSNRSNRRRKKLMDNNVNQMDLHDTRRGTVETTTSTQKHFARRDSMQSILVEYIIFAIISMIIVQIVSRGNSYLNNFQFAGERELFLTRYPNIEEIKTKLNKIFIFAFPDKENGQTFNFTENSSKYFPKIKKDEPIQVELTDLQILLFTFFSSKTLTEEMKLLLDISPEDNDTYNSMEGFPSNYEKYGKLISFLSDDEIKKAGINYDNNILQSMSSYLEKSRKGPPLNPDNSDNSDNSEPENSVACKKFALVYEDVIEKSSSAQKKTLIYTDIPSVFSKFVLYVACRKNSEPGVIRTADEYENLKKLVDQLSLPSFLTALPPKHSESILSNFLINNPTLEKQKKNRETLFEDLVKVLTPHLELPKIFVVDKSVDDVQEHLNEKFNEKKDDSPTVLILHPKFKEGVTIKGISDFYMLDSPLIYADYNQARGRAARIGTHQEGGTITFKPMISTLDRIQNISGKFIEVQTRKAAIANNRYFYVLNVAYQRLLSVLEKTKKNMNSNALDSLNNYFKEAQEKKEGNEVYETVKDYFYYLKGYYGGFPSLASVMAQTAPEQLASQRNIGLQYFFDELSKENSEEDKK